MVVLRRGKGVLPPRPVDNATSGRGCHGSRVVIAGYLYRNGAGRSVVRTGLHEFTGNRQLRLVGVRTSSNSQ
jgi:hypothetical protein